jgi:hypothetical protein
LWYMRNLSSQGTSYIHWGLSIHLRPYPLMYKNELHFLLLPRQVFTVNAVSHISSMLPFTATGATERANQQPGNYL